MDKRRTGLLAALPLHLALALMLFASGTLLGCAAHMARPRSAGVMAVPGWASLVPTGVVLQEGGRFSIEEVPESGGLRSEVIVRKGGILSGVRKEITACGTFTLQTEDRNFPLPSVLDDGRFPAYCLIGRIGEQGRAFYVGPRYEGMADASGALYLGINDPNPGANRGQFLCRLETQSAPAVSSEGWPREVPDEGSPLPARDANVVVFFVDGLRPDVLVEMAQMGHMPNVRALFLDNGAWVRNAFTLLPSLTQTSFASLMTGTFPDKHGLKMQVYYDRRRDLLFDGLSKYAFPRVAAAIEESGVKALYDYFPGAFGAGALPFQPCRPQVVHANLAEFAHRALNAANYASNIPERIDEAQSRFALDLASFPRVKAMVVWLPMVDMASGRYANGQFGGARAAVANADQCIGRIVERLKLRGRFDHTYFVLVSDHGHVGGDGVVNEKFDLEREIFHKRLRLGAWSMWHRFPCPLVPSGRFGAVGDGEGAVEIFLPFRAADSQDMSRPNTFKQLESYPLADDGGAVNVVDLFTESVREHPLSAKGVTNRPVDLAVAKVDEDTVLVQRSRESQALIRRRQQDGELLFQYVPVKNYSTGRALEPLRSGDPLGYLDDPRFSEAVPGQVEDWLQEYHTGREWLRASGATRYPGAVDAMSRFFYRALDHARPDADAPDPDLLLFASAGWVFMPSVNTSSRGQERAASRHGMAFRESVRICLFFSGPGIRKGCVIEEPHRIVDVLPTVLVMASKDWKGLGLDGAPVQGIWEDRVP